MVEGGFGVLKDGNKKVGLKYNSPLVNSVPWYAGCIGGGHPTMQSYI